MTKICRYRLWAMFLALWLCQLPLVSFGQSPTAVCRDTVLYLNSNGAALLSALDLDGGSTDDVGITFRSISQTDYSCNDLTTVSAELFISEYIEGSSNNKALELFNGTGKTLDLATAEYEIEIYTNGSTTVSQRILLTGQITPFGTYQIVNPNAANTLKNLADLETGVMSFTGNDAIVLRKNGVVIDALGEVGNNADWGSGTTLRRKSNIITGDNTEDDLFTVTDEWDNFAEDTFDGFGTHQANYTGVQVTLTVTDADNNSDNCTSNVIVLDTIAPALSCQPVDIYLNSSGIATLTANEISTSFSDNCSISSTVLSKSDFNCNDLNGTSNIGELFFSEYIEGSSNNKAVEIYNGTGSTIDLDAGNYTIETYFNNSSTAGMNISLTGNVANNDVFVFASSSAVSSITNEADQLSGVSFWNGNDAVILKKNGVVIDAIGKIAENIEWGTGIVSTQDNTLRRKSIVTQGDTNPNDAFDPADEWDGFAQDTFDGLGSHSVVNQSSSVLLTVIDPSGNRTSCAPSITVLDTVRPTAIANGTTLYLDASGVASVTATQLNNGSTDNCNVDSIYLSQSNFDCTDLGENQIRFYAKDASDNVDSLTLTIQVLDTTAPKANATAKMLFLDADGQASISAIDLNNGSTDNCGIDSIGISQTDFNCQSEIQQNILFAVYDASGNVDSIRLMITVSDTTSPQIIAKKKVQVYLGEDGTAILSASQADSVSTDNCGIETLTINQTDFDCDDIGDTTSAVPTINELFISEYMEGSSRNKVLELYNGTGNAINLGADNYTIERYTNGNTTPSPGDIVDLSGTIVDSQAFVIKNSGETLGISADFSTSSSAMDFSGDDAVALKKNGVIVDIIGKIGQRIVWGQGTNESTEQNTLRRKSSVTQGDTNGDDDFDPSQEWEGFGLNVTSGLGSHSVDAEDNGKIILTATDSSGNTSSVEVMIEILDTLKPSAVVRDTTLYLNADGAASVTAALMLESSADNCAVDTFFLARSSFDCDDAGKTLEIGLTVRDIHGNDTVIASAITVLDTISPIITCPADIVINNNPGANTASVVYLDPFFDDNCNNGLTLERTAGLGSGANFPIGTTTETYTVTDASGNKDSCSFSITVNYVNEQPSFTLDANPVESLEDQGLVTVTNWAIFSPTLLGTPNGEEATQQVLEYVIDNVSNPGLFSTQPSVSAAGTLTYQSAPDAFGTSSFTLRVRDDGGTNNGGVDLSDPQTISILVLPVNDAPTLNPIADQQLNNLNDLSISLSGIGSGAANEDQTLSLSAFTDNAQVAATVNYSSPNTTGQLTLSFAGFFDQDVTVSLLMMDDGGTENGGVDESEVQFRVSAIPEVELFAPTLFTPNGDGNNDTFIIKGNLSTINLIVYDREGNEVFRSSDAGLLTGAGWDGKDLPTGVYIYRLSGSLLNGQPIAERTGQVQLSR